MRIPRIFSFRVRLTTQPVKVSTLITFSVKTLLFGIDLSLKTGKVKDVALTCYYLAKVSEE